MNGMEGIDRLAEVAARRAVPAGDADAVVREALVVGRARARAAARRRLAAWSAGGVLGLVLLAWLVPMRATPVAGGPGSEGAIALRAYGHRIEALAGAEIEALAQDATHAVWRLDEGAALFEVAALGADGSFEVRTPDATVRVHGTVFGVSVDERGTAVDVYEGRVEVRDARGERMLGPGESYATSRGVEVPEALIARGERAAGRRAMAAQARSADQPVAGSTVRARAADPQTVGQPGAVTVPSTASARADVHARTEDEPSPAARSTMSPRAGQPGTVTAPPQARTADEPSPAAPPRALPRRLGLAEVRALCERGEFEAALGAIARAHQARDERGEWAMLEGDARRALGQSERAARAYERAAAHLSPTRAALAGFLAATEHQRAGDAALALAAIERTQAAERGSPLEERALAMRATLLAQVGRADEARRTARAYLAAFPGGEAIARMEALAGR